MTTFNELFGGDTGVPESLRGSIASLDEAMQSIGGLRGPLDLLRSQVESNIEELSRQAQAGERSSADVTRAIQSEVRALEELSRSIAQTTDNQVVGADALAEMTAEVLRVSDRMNADSQAISQHTDVLNEQIDLEEEALSTAQKRLAVEMAAIKGIKAASDALGGLEDKLESTTVDMDGLRKNLTAAGLGKLRERTLEQGLERGQRRRRGAGLLAGGIAAGLVGMAMATVNRQRKAIEIAAAREFQYGGLATLKSARTDTLEAMKGARNAAREFARDEQEMVAAMGRLAAETGTRAIDTKETIREIARLSLSGVGTVDELTSQVIELTNTLGITSKEAANRIRDVAVMAKALEREVGGRVVIQMNDFTDIINKLAESSEALVPDHKKLAHVMTGVIKVADKLNLSYNRTKNAAQKLTNAVMNQYNEGFATLRIQKELNAAVRDPTTMKRAQDIQAMLQSGQIDPAMAARLFRTSGLAQSEEVFADRIMFAAKAMEKGNARIAEAMFEGFEFDMDTIALLKEISKLSGQNVTFKDMMSSLTDKDRKNLKDMQKAVGKQMGLTAGSLASATLDDLMTSLAKTFSGALDLMVDALTGIKMSIEFIKDIFNKFANSPWGKKFGLKPTDPKVIAKRQAEEKRRTAIKVGTGSLALRLADLGGQSLRLDQLRDDPKMMFETLLKDKSLQEKFIKSTRSAKGITPQMMQAIAASAQSGYLSKNELTGLIKALGLETGMKNLKLGRLKPDGKVELENFPKATRAVNESKESNAKRQNRRSA